MTSYSVNVYPLPLITEEHLAQKFLQASIGNQISESPLLSLLGRSLCGWPVAFDYLRQAILLVDNSSSGLTISKDLAKQLFEKILGFIRGKYANSRAWESALGNSQHGVVSILLQWAKKSREIRKLRDLL